MAKKQNQFIRVSQNKKQTRTYINYITPRGRAIFPALIEPDEYEGKKTWKVSLAIPAAEAEQFIAELQPILDEFVAEEVQKDPKKDPAKKSTKWVVKELGEEELDDNGDPTGNIVFRFKRNFTTKTGDQLDPPGLFDARNADLSGKVRDIWGGSTLKVAGLVTPYAMGATKTFGISLKIDGVQVLDLKAPGQGSGPSADRLGFGVEEGGFTADDADDSDDDDDAPFDADDGPDADEF